jgi:hypothetical protein
LQADLERAFGRRVDLVRLDRASVLLRWRAAREGAPLSAEPRHEWPRFVARAGIDHAELAALYARAAEGFRRALGAEHRRRWPDVDVEIVLRKLAVLRGSPVVTEASSAVRGVRCR